MTKNSNNIECYFFKFIDSQMFSMLRVLKNTYVKAGPENVSIDEIVWTFKSRA